MAIEKEVNVIRLALCMMAATRITIEQAIEFLRDLV